MSVSHNVLKLMTGRIASQVITFVTSMVVARMFIPEDFGARQIFVSILLVFTAVACLQYDSSIPLGRNDQEASASLALSMLASILFSMIALVAVSSLKTHVAGWFGSPDLGGFLWLLPIAILISSLQSALQYWLGYKMRFGTIAWAEFVSSVTAGLTPIGWYFIYGRSPSGLLASVFVGIIIATLIFSFTSYRGLVASIRDGGFVAIVRAARQHKQFPIYEVWSSLLHALSFQLVTFILGLYFPAQIVGQYSLSYKAVGMPMLLLSGSITQVIFPAASKEYGMTASLSNLVGETFKRLVQIGVFPMTVLGYFGATLFALMFGRQWGEAGVYAQILSGWMFLMFITSPLTVVFLILNRQGMGLLFNAGLLMGRFLALFFGVRTGNPRIALALFVIVSVIGLVALLEWIFRNTRTSRRVGVMTVIKYASLSCLLLLPSVAIDLFLNSRILTIVSIGFSCVAYGLILYRYDPGISGMITNLVKR